MVNFEASVKTTFWTSYHIPSFIHDTFVAMPTGALLLVLTAPLLLSLYVHRFRRAAASQRAAALSSLSLQNDAHIKKKKFIGFFHPYW